MATAAGSLRAGLPVLVAGDRLVRVRTVSKLWLGKAEPTRLLHEERKQPFQARIGLPQADTTSSKVIPNRTPPKSVRVLSSVIPNCACWVFSGAASAAELLVRGLTPVTTRSPAFKPSVTSVKRPSLIPVLIRTGSGQLHQDPTAVIDDRAIPAGTGNGRVIQQNFLEHMYTPAAGLVLRIRKHVAGGVRVGVRGNEAELEYGGGRLRG